ncbi:MAG: DUF177 domain-containing protein [Alphaproteobacteria bacterium]|nr:DUF177 domain-containing protein [Alphaproteobacteria bacterium]
MRAAVEMPIPIQIDINADSLGSTPSHINFRADAAACKALAVYLKVDSVDNFQAELKVTRWRKHGAKVQGVVSADIVQQCVVTLAPVHSKVTEPVDARFLPAAMLEKAGADGPEVTVDPLADDPPEPYVGRIIHLGPLVLEYLALGIEAYPRAPGAVLPAGLIRTDAENEKRANPFQVLAQLRNKMKD